MLLEYEVDILSGFKGDSTLFVSANGLTTIHSAKRLLSLYANRHSFTILLNASEEDAEYFCGKESEEETTERGGDYSAANNLLQLLQTTPKRNETGIDNHGDIIDDDDLSSSSTSRFFLSRKYFTKISGMTVQQRRTAYKGGGVFYGSARAFLLDFLCDNLDIPKISSLVVLNAERAFEDSPEAFIVYCFKKYNKPGLVWSFSDTPLLIRSVSLTVLSKALCFSSLKLYPRFSKTVSDSLPAAASTAKFVSLKQSAVMEYIGLVLIDLFKLVENSTDSRTNKDDRYNSDDGGSMSSRKSIDYTTRIIRALSAPKGRRNRTVVMLARLISIFFATDSLNFYCCFLQMIEYERQQNSQDSFIALPECILLLGKAEEYLMAAMEGSGLKANDVIGEIKSTLSSARATSRSSTSAAKSDEEEQNKEQEEEQGEEHADEDLAAARTLVMSRQFYTAHPKFKALCKIITEECKGLSVVIVLPRKAGIIEATRGMVECLFPDNDISVLATEEMDRGQPAPLWDAIIMLSPNLRTIRVVERYCAVSAREKPAEVYVLSYKNSIEEQLYLTEVSEENDSFERLAEEHVGLSVRPSLEILDLEEYDGREQEYEVVVDSRELRAKLPFYLFKARNKVVVSTLDIGDYILGNWCIERKTVEDFRSSLNSGRLYAQALKMVHSSWHPVLLIEFDESNPTLMQYETRDDFKSTLVAKFCLFLYTFSQFRVLWSNNHLLSARLFRDLQKKSSFKQDICLRVDPVLQEMVYSIPGISTFSLRTIFSEYKSIEDIAFSSLERLERVLERESARQVYEFFRQPIREKQADDEKRQRQKG